MPNNDEYADELESLIERIGAKFSIPPQSPFQIEPRIIAGIDAIRDLAHKRDVRLRELETHCGHQKREIADLKSQLNALRTWVRLHPYGACTCGGEGTCGWCRRDAALQLGEVGR